MSPKVFSNSRATFTSSTGSALKDIRSVDPIPIVSNAPIPAALFTVPVNSVPASVIPRCRGYGITSAAFEYAAIAIGTSEALSETIISWKSRSSKIFIWYNALSTIASGVGYPYFSSR
ncbi:hypothetical protein D3C77_529890 [compost metagenome]